MSAPEQESDRDTVAYWAKDPSTPGWSPWAPVEVPDSIVSPAAASDRPGHTVLVWRDPDKAQLRTTSYDSTAAAPAWKPSVAISAEKMLRKEPALLALSSGPGLVTVVTQGNDGGVYATHTNPTRPTGWLDAPVKLSGDATDIGFTGAAAAAPGSVVVLWLDNGTGTLMATFQDARGAWGPPRAAAPAGAVSLSSDLTVTCPSPGVVLVVWTMNYRTLHSVTYDSHAISPAWSAPAQIAEFPADDSRRPSTPWARATGRPMWSGRASSGSCGTSTMTAAGAPRPRSPHGTSPNGACPARSSQR